MNNESQKFRLPKYASPSRYKIQITPDLNNKTFVGNVEIEINILNKTNEISLNVAELDIKNIFILISDSDKTKIRDWKLDDKFQIMKIFFQSDIPEGKMVLGIDYSGILNDKLRGFYHSTFKDSKGNLQSIATTQFESTDARRAFPCFDEPEYKSVFSISLIIDPELFCVSNAATKQVTENFDKKNRKKIEFQDTIPMSTYLVAFIVGPLEASKTIDVDGTELRIIYPIGKGHLCDFALELGKYSLQYFSSYYKIPYPGDKLDMIAIPDFAFGAMENLGCITYREALLLVDDKNATSNELIRIADVIAHEIAHMWFGDLVTMRWWNGIWLNEAFATFMATKAVADYKKEWDRWSQFSLEKSMAMDIDSLNTTRPIEYPVISPSDADGMFDLITYEKGGSILRMLEQFLGEDVFRNGVSLYLTKHSYGNTETDDLWNALEEVSNAPVKKIMDSWIFQPGHPIISYSVNNEFLNVSQEVFRYLGSSKKSLWGVPLFIKCIQEKKIVEKKFLMDKMNENIKLPEKTNAVFLNSNAYGFYRINGENSENSVPIKNLSSEEKYSVIDDFWALVLNGSKNVDNFLDICENFTEEYDPDILTLLYATLTNLDRNLYQKSRLYKIVNMIFNNSLQVLEKKKNRSIREVQSLSISYRAMCLICKDKRLIDKAKKMLDDFIDNKSSFEPDVISSIISINAYHGDENLFQIYLDLMKNAKTPQDEVRFQRSLSLFQGKFEIKKLFCLILNNEIRSQDSPYLLASALNNEKNGWMTWNFIEKNWEKLTTTFPENSIVRMLSGIRSLNTRENFNHLKNYFSAPDKIKQGKLQLDQHLEKLEINVKFKERI